MGVKAFPPIDHIVSRESHVFEAALSTRIFSDIFRLHQGMDDFQDKSDRFCAWFKANGGALRDDLIEIRDLGSRKAGRGIGKQQ